MLSNKIIEHLKQQGIYSEIVFTTDCYSISCM